MGARGGMGWETGGVILTRSRGEAEEDAERQKEREDFERGDSGDSAPRPRGAPDSPGLARTQ